MIRLIRVPGRYFAMNRYWSRFICSALLWVALDPLSASAQFEADQSWWYSTHSQFTGTAKPGSSLWIDIEHSVPDLTEKSEQESRKPFPWRTTPPDSPDWKGAARDTAYFMVYQTIVIGLLYVAPESISGWSDEDKENYDSGEWEENVQDPHRDTDTFFVNYILHPYWGATYYVRGRERGFTRPQSFLFSAALSALYEFGLEAMFEQPSYQDLWITPVVGSLVGEYWFTPVRNRIKAQPGKLTWQDKTILFFTDPLGVISTGTDRLLGLDTKVQVHAFRPGNSPRLSGQAGSGNMALLNSLPVRAEPAYGLQLSINW